MNKGEHLYTPIHRVLHYRYNKQQYCLYLFETCFQEGGEGMDRGEDGQRTIYYIDNSTHKVLYNKQQCCIQISLPKILEGTFCIPDIRQVTLPEINV